MSGNAQRPGTPSIPIEDFLRSLGSQLDRAQESLALKVRAGRPLTWALKDISLDLQVFVEHDAQGRVTWRHAAPNEQGASRITLTFTTITRSMVEENTNQLEEDDPRSLDDLRSQAKLSEADQRQLDWLGIRTVGQFKRLSEDTDPRAVQALSGIPVDRLSALLQASARPMVSRSEMRDDADGQPLVHLYGANLVGNGATEVHLNGEAMEVVDSRPHRLVVRPMEHHRDGQVEVTVGRERATGFVRLGGRGGTSGSGASGAPATTGDRAVTDQSPVPPTVPPPAPTRPSTASRSGAVSEDAS
jgi:hypothetical protein